MVGEAVSAPTPVQPICRFVVEEAYSTTHTTYLLGKAGRLLLKPLGSTKAEASEGILMTTFSSTEEAVAWLRENLRVSEL